MKTMLSAAIKFAVEKHDGQFDRSGQPYVLHVLKVCHYLKTDDEELMCIAILHDVVEDCFAGDFEEGFKQLFYIGMSQRVVSGVAALSHHSTISYDDYLDIVITNPDAVKVKMCDLRHNMDVRRLKGVTEKDLNRIAKYAKAYQKLKGI